MHDTKQPVPATRSADGAAARFFYRGPVQEESLARLHYLIDHHKRIGLLVGPDGSGKTSVLNELAREVRHGGAQVVSLNLRAVDDYGFLWTLAAGLNCRIRATDTARRLWQSIADAFEANRYLQLPTVLLLDDADQAGSEVMASVTRLVNGCLTDDSATTVILSANVRNVTQLDARLLDLAALRIELEYWDDTEVSDYLHGLLATPGIDPPHFDADAVARLRARTGGQPRRVCQLVDLARAAALNQQIDSFDAEAIDAIAEELSAATP